METVLVEKKNINEVVELLKQDEVVAFPTETVFGLGVKFGNLSALEKIYEIKHRSHSKAVSLMIYDSQDIEKYAYVNTNAQKLIDEFMPGMITLVLKKKSILSDDITPGIETIGNGKLKMIVKGKCKNTLASTVVKIDDDVTILRQGCISEEKIREVLK